MTDANGLHRLLSAARVVESGQMLRALSTVICSLLPHPRELYNFHRDEFVCPMEKLKAVDVLKRIRYLGYDTFL